MGPAVLVPMAIAAVSSGLQVFSQVQAAKAQNAVFKQNQENALQAMRDDQAQRAAQSNEDRQATADDILAQTRAAAQAKARSEAAGASANIAGISVDQLINEVGFQSGENIVNTAANLTSRENQRAIEAEGARTQTISRINSVQRAGVSPIVAALQIGLSTAQAGATAGVFGGDVSAAMGGAGINRSPFSKT